MSRNVRILALSLVLLVCVGAATVWLSHRFIDAVHRGDLFPALLEHRTTKPVEHYHSVVNRLVAAAYLVAATIAAVLYSVRLRSGRTSLAILLFADSVLCLLSERYGGLLDVRVDHAIPEWFQYFKEGSAAVLLFLTFRRTRMQVFLGWACLFGFMLLDDALKYHERGGVLLANLPGVSTLAASLSVRAIDLGEMISVAPVLLVLVLVLAVPYSREGADARRVVHSLGGLLVLLILAGGLMDIIDRIAVTRGSTLVQVLSLLEEGGEMVVMSCFLGYILTLWWSYGSPRPQGDTGKRWST